MSNLKRAKSFLEKPKEGWLHDEQGLQTKGVFFQFPVQYIGYYEMKESLRFAKPEDQTLVLREIIARVAEEARCRPVETRKVPKSMAQFEGGQINVVDVKINLGISAKGFVLSPFVEEGERPDTRVIAFHEMTSVSLCAGGENSDFDLVAYVGKQGRLRAVFVFDCGSSADNVLVTIGQSFNLAIEFAERKRKAIEEKKKAEAEALKKKGVILPPTIKFQDPTPLPVSKKVYDEPKPARASDPQVIVQQEQPAPPSQYGYGHGRPSMENLLGPQPPLPPPTTPAPPPPVEEPDFEPPKEDPIIYISKLNTMTLKSNSFKPKPEDKKLEEKKKKEEEKKKKEEEKKKKEEEKKKKEEEKKKKAPRVLEPAPLPEPENVALKDTPVIEHGRPSWVYFSDKALVDGNTISLDQLRREFLRKASTVGQIEEESSSSDED